MFSQYPYIHSYHSYYFGIHIVLQVLIRIYGKDEISKHDYSNTLTSVAFAGTIVGMLTFGYMSDKLGRKFGMVREMPACSDAIML